MDKIHTTNKPYHLFNKVLVQLFWSALTGTLGTLGRGNTKKHDGLFWFSYGRRVSKKWKYSKLCDTYNLIYSVTLHLRWKVMFGHAVHKWSQ